LAGVSATIHFLASLGIGNSLRERIVDAYRQIAAHEHPLAQHLFKGLKKLDGVKIAGQDFSSSHRSPTVSFSVEGKTPAEICAQLARKNICAWDGHFYALRAIQILGLYEKGGVTRLGISIYNTKDEINFVLGEIKDFLL
jgi:selenocysteine lyase/cysteine desulfurase